MPGYDDFSNVVNSSPYDAFSDAAPLAVQSSTFQNTDDEKLYRETLRRINQDRSKPQAPFYVRGPEGQEINLNEVPAEELALDMVRNQRSKEAEQQAFDESRTPAARVTDTAVFAPSSLVRAATQGEYGLGDLVGTVAPETGEAIAGSEADFARANRPGLELMGRAGEISLGIPFLSTMGAPARGVSATAKTIANRPSARQLARVDTRGERLADVEAFERSGVQPFGPALTETGSAAAVKQLSEVPVVGQPIRNALKTAVEQTQDAGERVASQYGTARNFRDSGLAAERGLERFKDARPESIVDTAVSAMDDAQLAKVIGNRARDTSAKTRLAALFERAWRYVPEEMASGRSVDKATSAARKGGANLDQSRILSGMKETRKLLKQFVDEAEGQMSRGKDAREASPSLAYPVRGGQAGEIIASIIENRWRGPLQSMRNVRSNIRRLTSGMADTEKNVLSKSQMERIQGAITRDMTDLIERNIGFYTKNPKRKFQVSTAADGSPVLKTGAEIAGDLRKSVVAFKRADQATRRNAELLETLNRLYKTDNPEAIARSIFRDAQGGTKGNYSRLFALKRALKPDEWNEMTSGLIRELGTPVRSARGLSQETGFSVNTFLTNWRGLDPKAKNILFGSGENAGRVNALNDFVRVADKLANFEALVNSSRTATNLINFATLAGGGGLIAAGQIPALIVGGLGTYGLSAFLSSPAYVRWLTRAIDVQSNPNKMVNPQTYLKQLAKIAAKDPGSEAKFAAELFLQQLDQAANQSIRSQTNQAQPQSSNTMSSP